MKISIRKTKVSAAVLAVSGLSVVQLASANIALDRITALVSGPVLTYVNDYGDRKMIQFSCGETNCTAKRFQDKK